MLAVSACTRTPESRTTSLLFITIDTTRADHTSLFGYARATTPRLEQYAREGVLCDRAYAPMATTAPSHVTMFTGLLPRHHGVLRNGMVLDAGVETLAERLSSHGYRSAAVVSTHLLNGGMGLAQGFDSYDDAFASAEAARDRHGRPRPRQPPAFTQDADATSRDALRWLQSQGDLGPRPSARPFFLWVHFYDPHMPYAPAARYLAPFLDELGEADAQARLVAAYDAEISASDAGAGAILDALQGAGRLDDTLVVVTADHGEGLMNHGYAGHGPQLYEEAVRVPLLFRWPHGLPRDARVSALISHADLEPTLLRLLDLEPPPAGDGMDLALVLRARAAGDMLRPLLFQRREYESQEDAGFHIRGEKLALRVGRYKYIEARDEDSFELYDLDADPGELKNLLPEKQAHATAMTGILDRWRSVAAARAASDESPEMAEALRALGYVR
jgi:arylsulfatase A-like enzyme